MPAETSRAQTWRSVRDTGDSSPTRTFNELGRVSSVRRLLPVASAIAEVGPRVRLAGFLALEARPVSVGAEGAQDRRHHRHPTGRADRWIVVHRCSMRAPHPGPELTTHPRGGDGRYTRDLVSQM